MFKSINLVLESTKNGLISTDGCPPWQTKITSWPEKVYLKRFEELAQQHPDDHHVLLAGPLFYAELPKNSLKSHYKIVISRILHKLPENINMCANGLRSALFVYEMNRGDEVPLSKTHVWIVGAVYILRDFTNYCNDMLKSKSLCLTKVYLTRISCDIEKLKRKIEKKNNRNSPPKSAFLRMQEKKIDEQKGELVEILPEVCELIEGKLSESGDILKFGSYFDYWQEVFDVFDGEKTEAKNRVEAESGYVVKRETVDERLILVDDESEDGSESEGFKQGAKLSGTCEKIDRKTPENNSFTEVMTASVNGSTHGSEMSEIKPDDLLHKISYEWSLNGSIENSDEERERIFGGECKSNEIDGDNRIYEVEDGLISDFEHIGATNCDANQSETLSKTRNKSDRRPLENYERAIAVERQMPQALHRLTQMARNIDGVEDQDFGAIEDLIGQAEQIYRGIMHRHNVMTTRNEFDQ